MKQRINKINFSAIIFTLILSAVFAMGIKSTNVRAASSGYKYMELYEPFTAVKTGKYYVKSSGFAVYISKKKDSNYKITPLPFRFCSNGKQAFYTNNNALYKYVFSSGKETKLTDLPVSGDASFNVSAVYGKQVLLTKGSFDQWCYWTYSYNTKTKKLKKIKTNCNITAQNGKYVVGEKEYRSDVGPYTLTLYRITSSGLKKIKKLSSVGREPVFVNGKLYYVSYKDNYMKKATLYRCKSNGTNRKKLASFSTNEEYGMVIVNGIGAKKCRVYKNNTSYEYTYSTKKYKKINN